MRKILWSVLAVFALGMLASAVGRGPSTAEERQRFLTLTHNLEQAPLNQSLYADRAWAYKWLSEIPDLQVHICTKGLGDFAQEKYQFSNEITYQLVYSTAAFLMEHPDKAKDVGNVHVAAVEGTLKAYSAILKSKPDAKSPALDLLLQKQRQGTFTNYVRDITQTCR